MPLNFAAGVIEKRNKSIQRFTCNLQVVTWAARPIKYLLNVSQRLGVPAQLLALLLLVEAGVGARLTIGICGRYVSQGTERGVKDHLVVPDQKLHDERLVGIVHQGGEGNLCVRLPRFDQRRTEDDA